MKLPYFPLPRPFSGMTGRKDCPAAPEAAFSWREGKPPGAAMNAVAEIAHRLHDQEMKRLAPSASRRAPPPPGGDEG